MMNNMSEQYNNITLSEAKDLAGKYYNYEQAVKLMLNSIYGAFGNKWFYFFNVDIAETITIQGKDAILYTEKMINRYFYDFWHKDTVTHKELGIQVTDKIKNPVGIYIDTDSIYMKFEEVIEKSTWEGEKKEFILHLYQARLKEYIEKILQKYADDRGVDNFLNFELESIANSAIWLSKKKYMQNIVWHDPDIHFDNLTNISTKGFEIVQSSTPLFARQKLEYLVRYIFSSEKLDLGELVKLLKDIKREFKVANIDHISFSKKANNYQRYILNDVSEFEIGPKCPINVRAAGYHNYLLNNSSYTNKYQKIGNGEKIKYYHADDNHCDVFAYAPGDHPYEFAPPIDYELQFEKTIIDPINRVLKAMGFKELSRDLIYVNSVF